MFFNEEWDKIFKIDPLSRFLNTTCDLDQLQEFIKQNRSLYEQYWSEDALKRIEQFKKEKTNENYQ